MSSSPEIRPFVHPAGSGVDFGATVTNVDVENITDAEFDVIRDALFTHQVLVFKNQGHATPKAQYELTQRFDPTAAGSYGHGKTIDAARSVLHPDLKTIPHQPQVQVIGHGVLRDGYEGLPPNVRLRHPHHRTFHADHVPDADDLACTRFYRWHIDAALYGRALAPPVATTLLAVRVPRGRVQTVRYDDGSGDAIPDAPLGTTAFVSGYALYDRLSAADQALARAARVEYAPHPYVWMSGARSRPTGLGLVSEGRELAPRDLPPVDPADVQILPMCWRNPVTGRLALQVHPSAVRRLHLHLGHGREAEVVDDLEAARALVYRLQRPGIAPEKVYLHDWEEGDLVLFHNRGLLHSVVGAFADDEVRLFRQCNIAGSAMPLGPETEAGAGDGGRVPVPVPAVG
ncbi:Alpha-ketoglutarate-dependent xanthine dioxygenase xan-1 [Diatrype stigma]|uniref:Alpha-ketoglutarate-dependent xanthine dioxygenase xan-1 n=1 Tax=Diatrype stigma TaxID=117547 RepID=A0AAN9UPG8_9PEZI